MQIHEITKRPLREALLGNLARGVASGLTGFDIPQSQGSIDKNAAASAEKLRAQGYGQEKPLPTVQDAVAAVQKNPAQQQYIKGLVAQWKQSAPKAEPTSSVQQAGQNTYKPAGNQSASDPNWRQDALKAAGAKFPQSESKRRSKSKTSNKNPNWRQDALKSVGAAFDPPPAPRPAPGQMPASVAASKQGKLMLQAYGKPRGGIQDIDEAPLKYTTPGGIEVPAGTKTDQAPGAPVATPVPANKYKDDFLKWASGNLQTRVPGTGVTITLDSILKTDVKDELDRALDQVIVTQGDQQKNAVSVNNFLTIAVAGVARESQRIKQEYGRGSTAGPVPTGQAGKGIMTQQELRNKLASEVELNNKQLDALNKLGQDPASRQALLKSWGVQV
jgi:hypothetical protein